MWDFLDATITYPHNFTYTTKHDQADIDASIELTWAYKKYTNYNITQTMVY